MAKLHRTNVHADLVKAAQQWLKIKCGVVITEIATTGEEPDAIGWRGTFSILVECKASLSDFRADDNKYFRRFPELGIGQHRYYCVPSGLLKPQQVPGAWGLLEWLGGARINALRESQLFPETNTRHEVGIVLSTLRRIGHRTPRGACIKVYTHPIRDRTTLTVANQGDPEMPSI